MKRTPIAGSVMGLLLAASAVPQAEAGYMDPGTGGLLFQALAALFAVLSGFVLLFARRIKMVVARLRRWVRDRSVASQGPDSQ